MYMYLELNKNLISISALFTGILLTLMTAGDITLSYTSSSLIIICLMCLTCYQHKIISIPTFIIIPVYVPSLAFLWANIHGADYINYHDHWLQNDINIINTAVQLCLCSFLFTYSLIAKSKSKINNSSNFQKLNPFFYNLTSFLAVFFFWLTEPSFKTVLSTSYLEILDSRIDGTQFAGGLAIIFWLISFLNFSNSHKRLIKSYKWSNRLFILVTIFGLVWLGLHSRRSELIGMILVITLRYSQNNYKKAVTYFSLSIIFLVIIGEIRSLTLNYLLQNGFSELIETETHIKSIPGGISNVFQTYMTTIHHFQQNSFLYGETFSNYLLQVFPSFLYQILDINTPDFYSKYVLNRYSYNGGTYFLAVNYGNFGIIGSVISGFFIGTYIQLSIWAIKSKHVFLQLLGAYLIAISMRGFWYELITIIKPVVMVILPIYLLFILFKKASR